MTEAINTWRRGIYDLLEGHKDGGDGSRLIQGLIVALIVLNGAAVVLESNRPVYFRFEEWFTAFELFSVTVFTIEYLGRFWVSTETSSRAHLPAWRARLAFVISPMAVIDLLAVAPFYLSLLIPIDLRYLRFFRLLRLLKLSHYFDGLQVFLTVLQREAGAMAGALLTMTVLIVVSACLMFTVENAAMPGHFETISEAIWWAVVTLTTVGYGDITPITFAGKLLAIAIMLLGVGTMALPAGILAARFTEELQSRRELIKRHVKDALRDGALDATERKSIEELQQRLGLAPDVVERLIAQQRHLLAHSRHCPHCGERLDHE
jgi:voltage-gated potassium channel